MDVLLKQIIVLTIYNDCMRDGIGVDILFDVFTSTE